MRKRWKVNPAPWLALWGIGGFIGLFVVQGLTGGCQKDYPSECGMNGPPSKAMIIEAVIWLGPAVLYLAAAIVIGSTRALWEARPRRIEEPVVEDLRKIHPPS